MELESSIVLPVRSLLSLTNRRRLDVFYHLYALQRKIREDGVGDHKFLGSKLSRKCRFCGKSWPNITFKKKAHVIPRQLEGKTWLNCFECDKCNGLFSLYESSSGAYLKPIRSLWEMSKYNGKPPVYKHPKTGPRIEQDEVGVKIISSESVADSLTKFNFENNSAELELWRDTYIPVHVFKAIIHIGLCLLDEDEVPRFSRAFKWLQSPEIDTPNINCNIVSWGFEGKPIRTEALLFKRKIIEPSDKVPKKILILGFANIQYQIPFLSFSDEDTLLQESHGMEWSIPLLPPLLPIENWKAPNLWLCGEENFNSIEKRCDDKVNFSFTSPEPFLIIPPKA